jgi:hypothetical protein
MTQVVLRLTLSSNSIGPFNVYVNSMDDSPVFGNVSRDELKSGLILDLEGSVSGIVHKVYVESLQDICDTRIIEKDITVFSEEPDPSPSPSVTPSSSQTPTPTPSSSIPIERGDSEEDRPTPTPSITSTPTSTPSVSVSVTPTVTPSSTPPPYGRGFLIIEPVSSSLDVVNELESRGIDYPDFFGFNVQSFPTTIESLTEYVNLFSDNEIDGLRYYELDIPLSGERSFLFDEVKVPLNVVDGFAWYTFIIPDEYLDNGRMTKIEFSKTGFENDSDIAEINLNSNLYDYGVVNYEGDVFENNQYRIYTTWFNQSLKLNNSTDLYFRGKKIN